MNDTINDKQSTEDGGAVGKPAVMGSESSEHSAGLSDYQKAIGWFLDLPYEQVVAICLEANGKKPHEIRDSEVVAAWRKLCP